MSLVGSLEELGLGDILQMVALSRKSGLLLVRSEEGDGRIVFEAGLVRAACVEGEPAALRELLVAGGVAEAETVDRALSSAQESGRDADEVVAERTGLGVKQLRSLRREHVERAVLRMFRWRAGEFRFDITDGLPARDAGLALATGISPQYLTIEAIRLGDEGRSSDGEDDIVLGGDDVFLDECAPNEAAKAPALASRAALEVGPTGEASPPPVDPPAPEPPALVVIDSELRTLEWLKDQLAPLFARVHIFQHPDLGIARIRQYLGRGQIPAVLVSSRVPRASLAGATDTTELLRRLRAQAPQMPILALQDADAQGVGLDAADAVVARPPSRLLADPRRQGDVEALARELRGALAPWSGQRRTRCD